MKKGGGGGGMRKQWYRILRRQKDAPCPSLLCVYNEDGLCDEPYVNKGNSDAVCHGMTYEEVARMLEVGGKREVKGGRRNE